jgi:glyoxylase-like metal-dependent hydrolase (beta-lactamase superfamily II)
MTRSIRTTWVASLFSVLLGSGGWAQQPDYETTRVAEGIYRFRWQRHHGLFVVTPAGVVAFDPISTDAARRYGAEVKRVVPGGQLVAVVYSHSDADHATGAPALIAAMGQTNVPIIAHEAAVAPIRRAASPDLPEPTVTFAQRLSMAPGGRRIELHYLGRNHTDNMLVGFVPDAGVVFAVDFVSKDRMGFQELPGYYFPDFFHSVTSLLDLPFTTVVFGHGPEGDRAAIQRQLAYYDDLRAATRKAVADGLTEDQAAEQVRLEAYAGWDQYAAWLPLNVRAMYRWVKAGGP